jgi:dephospho-CoA kinase
MTTLPTLHKAIQDSPRKIGLTGGTASGKSTVSLMLAMNGFLVIDFDQIALSVRGEPQIQTQILNHFGTTDPRELREQIFSSKDQREKLHEIMEYRILERGLELHNENLAKNRGPSIWDAALLIEFDLHPLMDQTLLVTSSKDQRLFRLTKRDHISLDLAQKMIQAQTSDEEKIEALKSYPHCVVENNGNLKSLEEKVNRFIAELRRTYGA